MISVIVVIIVIICVAVVIIVGAVHANCCFDGRGKLDMIVMLPNKRINTRMNGTILGIDFMLDVAVVALMLIGLTRMDGCIVDAMGDSLIVMATET